MAQQGPEQALLLGQPGMEAQPGDAPSQGTPRGNFVSIKFTQEAFSAFAAQLFVVPPLFGSWGVCRSSHLSLSCFQSLRETVPCAPGGYSPFKGQHSKENLPRALGTAEVQTVLCEEPWQLPRLRTGPIPPGEQGRHQAQPLFLQKSSTHPPAAVPAHAGLPCAPELGSWSNPSRGVDSDTLQAFPAFWRR